MPRLLVTAALAGLLVTGCVADVDGPSPAPDSTRADDVRQLRATLAEPAVELARAGQRLEAAVSALRTQPSDEPETRLAGVAAARSDVFALFEQALAAADEVDLPDDGGPDVSAAAEVWSDVRGAATRLLDAADGELELVGRLATVDAELRELTAVWDEPGSRRQQLEALDTAADRAESLADELEPVAQERPCPEDVQRRVDALRFVASVTRELREHASRHQGNAFDQRRAELAEDPYGLGGPLTDLDPSCWEQRSASVTALGSLIDGLEDLERVLNPPELASPSPSATAP